MRCPDTALLVAALTDEAETRRTQDWRGAQDPDSLAISGWVAAEFSRALSIKLRTGQIETVHCADAVGCSPVSATTVLPSCRCRGRSSARRHGLRTTMR